MINPFKKKAANVSVPASEKSYLSAVSSPGSGGWFSWIVSEANTGDWQKNIEWKRKDVVSHFAIFSCISLIASDISKLRINLMREDSSAIRNKIKYGKFDVVNKPNHYQNRIQFFESWIISKLSRGNTYVLKGRNNQGDVVKLYVLSPDCVRVLVSDTGEIFYQLSQDNLTGVEATNVTVPASEIIHDRFNCLYHPLVGLSPIFACGLAAYGGIKMIKNSVNLFGNMSKPGGILTAPGAISETNAALIKKHWEENYGGDNRGKTAVLGDDLKYTPINIVSAVDSQLVEQLKLTADIVCATFHVPPYKVIGNAPAYNNIEALEAAYYSQALQVLIESIELLLDEELETPEKTGFEFDLDGLLRMDAKTQVETLGAGVNKAIYAPNEARKKLNLKPVDGGDSPYLQQQNFSLSALSKRDTLEDPFSKQQVSAPIDEEKQMLEFSMNLRKELRGIKYDA